MCVGEAGRFLFTLEESEMQGSSILKLTGPFGSNHQMCHGKTATSWCEGRQIFASINICPSRLAADVVLTRLMFVFEFLSAFIFPERQNKGLSE